MHCQYCGSINGEDDHRCQRCGRRITGIVIAAPTSYIGATALAMQVEPAWEREAAPVARAQEDMPPLFRETVQAPAFLPDQKVIPFEQVQRQAAGRFAAAAAAAGASVSFPAPSLTAPAPKAPAPRPAAKRVQAASLQGNLDFRPGVPQGERVLATGVTAQVSGDGHVAPPLQRLTAGAMDASMVVLGFSLFAVTVKFGGSAFGSGKAAWLTLALGFVLISLFYGMIWAIARRETFGMNKTQLHLVTFDGSPLDARERTIRFAAAWLSYCSGGLGLLWALADEENLSFHDHISKTYPTEKGSGTAFHRARR